MIKIYKGDLDRNKILNRSMSDYGEYEKIAADVVENVRLRGDAALKEYSLKFDKAQLSDITVSEAEIDEACGRVDKSFFAALERAKQNIELYHRKQIKQGFSIEKEEGVILGQRYTPIARAGIYVPGGTASYPSSVLMNALPAKIAGVELLVMATPPDKNGKIKDEILAAAKLAGVDLVVKCGGAQAIAALAYGTESVPKVDKIVGPGNIFVTLAKKKVFGTVGIDGLAGPSEILIIADDSADAQFVAADLLSQAEHDKLASAVLITDSDALASAVQKEVERQLKLSPRFEIASASIENNGKIIVCASLDEAVKISDDIAPEHLELCCKKPFELLEKVKNASSVFLGNFSPEPLGDYYAGTNHVLPTGGNARFSSPMSVDEFVKKSSYLYYSPDALKQAADDVITLAESEGLFAHANAVAIRLNK